MCKWKRKNGCYVAYRNGIYARVKVDGVVKLSIRDRSRAWKDVLKNGSPWPNVEQAKSRGALELREAEKGGW